MVLLWICVHYWVGSDCSVINSVRVDATLGNPHRAHCNDILFISVSWKRMVNGGRVLWDIFEPFFRNISELMSRVIFECMDQDIPD